MADIKICAECGNYLWVAPYMEPECARTKSVDLVTGEARYERCRYLRASTDECGREGKFWVAKHGDAQHGLMQQLEKIVRGKDA